VSEIPRQFWKNLRSQADRTLGDQFWQDISGLIPTQQPRTDVYLTADRLFVIVELPGCKADAVKLSFHKNSLHIRGDLSCPYPVEEDELIVAERFFGPFHRKVELPPGISGTGMKARIRDGLLTVEFLRKLEADSPVDIVIDPADLADSDSEPSNDASD
jgi:HSP20 family protein